MADSDSPEPPLQSQTNSEAAPPGDKTSDGCLGCSHMIVSTTVLITGLILLSMHFVLLGFLWLFIVEPQTQADEKQKRDPCELALLRAENVGFQYAQGHLGVNGFAMSLSVSATKSDYHPDSNICDIKVKIIYEDIMTKYIPRVDTCVISTDFRLSGSWPEEVDIKDYEWENNTGCNKSVEWFGSLNWAIDKLVFVLEHAI